MATTKSSKFVDPFHGVSQTDQVSKDDTGFLRPAGTAAKGAMRLPQRESKNH
jgi:hypothetical protein